MLNLGIANKIGFGWLAKFLILQNKKFVLRFTLKKNKKIVSKRKKQKVFVIGFNKTGTTSIEKTLENFGYILGHQRTAELLFNDVSKKNYSSLIEYCKTAEAFQDVPFSFPNVYKILDKEFPNSKFILTVRDSSDQWYESLVNFHSKMWNNGNIPTKEVLANTNYVFKGYPLKSNEFVYGKEIYNKKHYINIYESHNNEVKSYFKEREEDFICINVSNNKDYKRLCLFLNVTSKNNSFVWENKTI